MTDTANIYEGIRDLDTMGGRLSRAREASGMTTKQLAWRLGVRTATIKAWETDRSQPRANRLTMLAGILNVSLSWVLHGIGTGPVEDEPEMIDGVGAQLERLKSLHAETGHLIRRIQGDLDRLSAAQ